ncbi:MAG: type 1 glutamine amidotransferase [Sphingobacteriales bacterium]|nr:MAG: type 1 glutamine amidotransferase [Sphingobacteriales bacterium]
MKKRIAILATNGFEESELKSPKEHLEQQGWQVDVVSPQRNSIRAWAKKDWGNEYRVDVNVDQARAKDYDALVLPGGVINPDQLRTNGDALQFIRDFFAQAKPVAAICHGPQLLIEAEVVRGRQLTSVENISTDLKNAGANWQNNEVVVDGNLITSRTPNDLPAFNKELVAMITNHTNA